LIEGVAKTISRDAIELSTQSLSGNNNERSKGSGFTRAFQGLEHSSRVHLGQRDIRFLGRIQLLGIVAQADIKTRERRVIDDQMSPRAWTVEEAGRERGLKYTLKIPLFLASLFIMFAIVCVPAKHICSLESYTLCTVSVKRVRLIEALFKSKIRYLRYEFGSELVIYKVKSNTIQTCTFSKIDTIIFCPRPPVAIDDSHNDLSSNALKAFWSSSMSPSLVYIVSYERTFSWVDDERVSFRQEIHKN
jgi:hypothetical protein